MRIDDAMAAAIHSRGSASSTEGSTLAFSVPLVWARCTLFVVPCLIVYVLLLGLLLDGCRAQLFVSDTMNNRHCVLYEAGGTEPRWSAILSRWTLWHAFFACELTKRILFLRRSKLRNAFAAVYCGLGLCALYSQGISLTAHGAFGGLFFLTMCCEFSMLWYPPCASCRPLRADRGGLAVSILIWSLCIFLFFIYFGAELRLLTDLRVGNVRVAAVLQWLIVTLSQAVYFVRAPIVLAEKRRAQRAVRCGEAEAASAARRGGVGTKSKRSRADAT